MDFCNTCLDIAHWIPNYGMNLIENKTLVKKTSYRETGTTCQLCAVILNNLDDSILKDRALRIDADKWISGVDNTQRRYCELSLAFRYEDDPPFVGRGRLPFALWADEGNEPSK